MEENKIKRFNILAICLIMIFCFSITPITLQNDTYYTIAIGKHISQNGIDMKDPFSWHENLPYTYPHWLYDLGTYYIYNIGETIHSNGGFPAIYIATIILSMILGIVIYITNTKLCKNNIVSFVITIASIYLLKPYIAARAQLVTFILFILTILFIEQYLETKHKRYIAGLLIIPILIANIHVAVWPFYFILFLPYIAEYVLANVSDTHRKIELKVNSFILKRKISKNKNTEKLEAKIDLNKKIWDKIKAYQEDKRNNPYKIKIQNEPATKVLIIIMIISIFTGFLTPLGTTPFTYLIKTREGNTMEYINEHLPLTLVNNESFLITITLFLVILMFTKVKIKLSDLIMFAGLLLLAFMTRRQVSMFVLICNFIFAKLITDLLEMYAQNFTSIITQKINTNIGSIILILLIVALSVYMFKPKIENKIVDYKVYPVDAAEYILNSLDIGSIRLFNEYNYGSYLLFKGIPVFIDSRADLYAPEFNRSLSEDGKLDEGRDIFTDFMYVSNLSKHYEDIFSKYDITHVILKKNSKVNNFISKDNKYKMIYEDKSFVIYER